MVLLLFGSTVVPGRVLNIYDIFGNIVPMSVMRCLLLLILLLHTSTCICNTEGSGSGLLICRNRNLCGKLKTLLEELTERKFSKEGMGARSILRYFEEYSQYSREYEQIAVGETALGVETVYKCCSMLRKIRRLLNRQSHSSTNIARSQCSEFKKSISIKSKSRQFKNPFLRHNVDTYEPAIQSLDDDYILPPLIKNRLSIDMEEPSVKRSHSENTFGVIIVLEGTESIPRPKRSRSISISFDSAKSKSCCCFS